VTAGLVAETKRRLVIPAPEVGWLTILGEADPERLLELVDGWSMMTTASAAAAQIPEYRRASVAVTFHPERVAKVGQPGVHVAEDLRPTWTVVRRVLALGKPPVRVHWEELRLGGVAEQGYLVVVLVEVAP
jgi:hypothetical protein